MLWDFSDVVELSVSMETATVGVEVEAGVVGGVGREGIGYPSIVALRNEDGNALLLIKAQSVAYLAVLN